MHISYISRYTLKKLHLPTISEGTVAHIFSPAFSSDSHLKKKSALIRLDACFMSLASSKIHMSEQPYIFCFCKKCPASDEISIQSVVKISVTVLTQICCANFPICYEILRLFSYPITYSYLLFSDITIVSPRYFKAFIFLFSTII